MIDPECCHICACDGLGFNCLYYGSICCAPKAVYEWSRLRSSGRSAADFNSKTIIINNMSPNPVYMQPVNGDYQITTSNRTYSNHSHGGMEMQYNLATGINNNMNMGNNNSYAGMNGNMGMGGNFNMNANMNNNMNTPRTNAKISF
jgi:hypothetical protein